MKAKKGYVAVQVGDCSIFQRFIIPISYLYNPLFERLLEESREMYGFRNPGLLTLPCRVDEFLVIQSQIKSRSKNNRYGIVPH